MNKCNELQFVGGISIARFSTLSCAGFALISWTISIGQECKHGQGWKRTRVKTRARVENEQGWKLGQGWMQTRTTQLERNSCSAAENHSY